LVELCRSYGVSAGQSLIVTSGSLAEASGDILALHAGWRVADDKGLGPTKPEQHLRPDQDRAQSPGPWMRSRSRRSGWRLHGEAEHVHEADVAAGGVGFVEDPVEAEVLPGDAALMPDPPVGDRVSGDRVADVDEQVRVGGVCQVACR
jgi:hypothetical protein